MRFCFGHQKRKPTHSKLGNGMRKLVFDAIGKYIHPTRYRQIVETQSLDALNDKEHRLLCEDQKHSPVFAKVHYQKRRSREIAVKADECLQNVQGAKGSVVDMEVNTRFGSSSSTVTFDPAFECTIRAVIFTTDEDDFLKRGIDKHGVGQ